MDCHKCKKPMTMTPVCSNCGSIPIAEASFSRLESSLASLMVALDRSIQERRIYRIQAGAEEVMSTHMDEDTKLLRTMMEETGE